MFYQEIPLLECVADFRLAEILTHILSHLHPDSHSSVALVSKRFYALVTTPHAWRMAFTRYFPGHDSLATKSGKGRPDLWDEDVSDAVRSETRYFARLTPLATWRSEYLLRTRLLRSLARGKPGTNSGGIGSSTRTSHSSKKASAVLTYNSKLPWIVTNIHAIFSNGKKPPRAIHGAADLGVATLSDPTNGKVEKWGLDDPFSLAQLEEAFPNLEPYGVGDGPAATPNSMDLSQPYGVVAGEGFPGGRAYYRSIHERTGRYLGHETGVVDTYPNIPKIPELSEAICTVWIAKSSNVPTTSHSMVGIITGSTLGIVTAYSLGSESSGPRYSNGDMTARWVLCPGVPIVSIKVDDSYNQKRKHTGRVWVVALNALGELFYLTENLKPIANVSKGDDITKNAWYAARSVYWHLVESTRRQASSDDSDKNAVRGAYSPRSPSNAMNLSKDQLAAEAREIEKFLRHKPSHFRKVCTGWDMKRKLEVDFGADDGDSAGESIFVIDSGWQEGASPRVQRYIRSVVSDAQVEPGMGKEAVSLAPALSPSIFGQASSGAPMAASAQSAPHSNDADTSAARSPVPSVSVHIGKLEDDWQVSTLNLKNHAQSEITATAIDQSCQALLTVSEDPLPAANTSPASEMASPQTMEAVSTIPGRRARLLAIGTKSGGVVIWNGRERSPKQDVMPVRVIQTESPEISCLALSSLYLVHGGSDGLVQAWDPLASTLDPVRTLNARPSGRVPRHMIAMNPALRNTNHSAVGAIFLDPDATTLRGVLSFGSFLRYWSYSSASQPSGRKRRLRHSDIHGRLATRRHGGTVAGYIAAETAELRREQEHRSKEQARLRRRFGLGNLTEEEAILYAQMMSEESFMLDEQRRTSASDTGSAADATSSFGSENSADTVTPEPSVTGASPPPPAETDESDYELQIQRALRLSLLEGVNDAGQSPRENSSGDYEFSVKYKSNSGRKGKRSGSSSPSTSHTPMVMPKVGDPSRSPPPAEDDMALAIRLSLLDQGRPGSTPPPDMGLGIQQDDFPPLSGQPKGKGKDNAV
jgi:hypothetical protein